MRRTYRILTRIFTACFLFLAAAAFSLSGVALALAAAVLLLWLPRRVEIRQFELWLFLSSFLLQLCVIFTVHTPVISDFAEMLQAAQRLRDGLMPYQVSTYFNLWPYQTGFVLWEAMWLAMWNNTMILKLVHALMASGLLCLLYRWLVERVREPAAQTAVSLLAVFPMYFTLCVVLTNQIAGAFFIVLAVWLLTCRDARSLRFWRYPLAGLSLFCSEFLRPEAIVALLAVLVLALFSLFHEPKQWKRLLCGGLVLCAVYLVSSGGADALFRLTGYSPAGLDNPFPEWKLICGLNTQSGGMWSLEEDQKFAATYDETYTPTAETKRLAREAIASELHKTPGEWLGFLHKKLSNLWYCRGFGWALSHTQNGGYARTIVYRMVGEADQTLFFLALGLAAFGLRGRKRPDELLPYFIVFALACAFLVIEVQPRYAYLPQIFLFTAAAFGIDRLPGLHREKGVPNGTVSGNSML